MNPSVRLAPVLQPLADLLEEHRDRVEAEMASLADLRERNPGRYIGTVNTWFGPIRIETPFERPVFVASLRLGPLAGGTAFCNPTLTGSSLMVEPGDLEVLPETVREAARGRPLGHLVAITNDFHARIEHLPIADVLLHKDRNGIWEGRIRLDAPLVDWT